MLVILFIQQNKNKEPQLLLLKTIKVTGEINIQKAAALHSKSQLQGVECAIAVILNTCTLSHFLSTASCFRQNGSWNPSQQLSGDNQDESFAL